MANQTDLSEFREYFDTPNVVVENLISFEDVEPAPSVPFVPEQRVWDSVENQETVVERLFFREIPGARLFKIIETGVPVAAEVVERLAPECRMVPLAGMTPRTIVEKVRTNVPLSARSLAEAALGGSVCRFRERIGMTGVVVRILCGEMSLISEDRCVSSVLGVAYLPFKLRDLNKEDFHFQVACTGAATRAEAHFTLGSME